MNAKVYFFRLFTGLTAFFLSLTVYFIWQSFSAKTVLESDQPKTVTTVSPVFVPLPSADAKAGEVVKNEAESSEFYPDGDYYLIGEMPKGFKDFDSLTITANKYEVEKDGTSYWKPILPEGHIFTKTKYKFSRIFINNREISFETERKKGISYTFIGTFSEEIISENEEDYIYLKGTLKKFRDGKKIAEIEAKFGIIDGC